MWVVSVSVFFFFKQKTAYEMRISDWSSDVCSSDLFGLAHVVPPRHPFVIERIHVIAWRGRLGVVHGFRVDIGRIVAGAGDRIGLGFEARAVAEQDHVIIHRHRIVGEMAVIGVMLADLLDQGPEHRSEEHTSELQSLMRISYTVFCLKKTTAT